jgi:uncharacterized protein YjiS (DUF1127 family)
MEQSLNGVFPLSPLDLRYDKRSIAARLAGTVRALSLRTFDPSVPHRSPLRASPDVPLGGRALRRAKTKPIAPLTAIRRIVAAIRLWRGRTRSRQQLRELDDHLLKDIGLKREDIVYTLERFTGSINILSREFEP